MPMEYPQVIVAIKEWIGKNKIQTDSTVSVSGQDGARKATLVEFFLKAAGDIAGTFLGGKDLLPGDSFSAAGEVVPGALRETITSIGAQVKDVVGGFGTSISDAWSTTGGQLFQNPFSDSVALAQEKGAAILGIYSDSSLSPEIQDAAADLILKAQPGGVWDSALASYHEFTNQLAGVTIPGTDGFTIHNAIDAAENTTNEFLSKITTIKKFDIGDLAGSLTNNGLMENVTKRMDELRALASFPGVTPEMVAAKVAEVDAAHQALSDQVASDQSNYASFIAQQNALEGIVGAGLNFADSNHQDLLQTIYKPTTLANVKAVADLKAAQDAAAVTQVPRV